jgi:UDP:flavonoid glycosyltransferase YjiC (YdhE family)
VHAPEDAGPPAAEHRGASFAALLADRERLRAWIRAMLVDAAEPSIAPLRAHLARARPDVVVIDPMAYFAAIAAHEEKLPWLGLSTSLNPCIGDDVDSELKDTLRSLDDARRALFVAHGMPAPRFRVSDVLSPRGTFVLSTKELLGDGLPDDGVPVHLVGAALPGGGAPAREAGPPLVYASFGSQAYHQPVQLGVVLEAARGVAARFVVAMGELASSPLARSAPPNVEVVSFAPQVALLAEASVAITHGGANSVHEALAHGVPLLVSPICNDQPHNAALVARAGAGRAVDLARATASEVTTCLRALLAVDAPERRAARAIARSYAGAGGAGRIADLVLGAA